jgi:hypothetical protein
MDQWKNQAVLVVDTNGYFAWNGSTWSQVTGGILPSTPFVSPDIAVYNGYVWIVSNRVLYISNPNQYASAAGTPINTICTFASGTNTITAAQTTSALGNIVIGSTVTGTGIPGGTTVTGAITPPAHHAVGQHDGNRPVPDHRDNGGVHDRRQHGDGG